MSQTTDFHFVSFAFVSQSTVSPSLVIYHFISSAPSWNNCSIYILSHSHGLKKSELTLVTATRLQRQLTRNIPMDSCHGNPSPSDPMESVCRHFPPPPQQLHCCIFTKSLANWLAAVRWILATATRLHRIRWSPFADIFHPLLSSYLAVYLLSLSRTDSRQSDEFLPRQPVSIGSDGVRLPTFSTPSSAATLLYIY